MCTSPCCIFVTSCTSLHTLNTYLFIGNGCLVAGFLTIFGNVLSVYTLAIITTERWYTISWAIQLNKRLKLRTAARVMIAGWVCAISMACFPLLGISSYSKTSICLPFENRGKADAIYQSTLLSFNAIAFALICVCYGSMYRYKCIITIKVIAFRNTLHNYK